MKLPKFEDWKAPWEVDLKEGDEPTFDFEKGKRYLYNVLSDKERLQDSNATLTTENKTLTDAANAKAREGETREQQLERELKEANAKLDAKPDGETPAEIRLRVALDKGLTLAQSKRLVGTTEEELAADADTLLTELGQTSSTGDDEEDDSLVRTAPQARAKAKGDPKPEESALDVEKFADNYASSRWGLG